MSQNPDSPSPEAAAGPETEAAAAPENESATVDILQTKLAEAEAKAQENWDKLLRANAELENVRRRAEREVANNAKFAAEKVMGDLLSVMDSLELGLKSAEDESTDRAALLQGVQLTHKQMLQALERQGVSTIDPAGQPFNPEQHEAVSMVESDQVAPNHVLNVMQKGYQLHERLLRPAIVIVARAPAKPADDLNAGESAPDSSQS